MKRSDVIAKFAASPTEFVELSSVERFEDGSGYRANIRIAAGEFVCTGRPFYFDSLETFIAGVKSGYEALSGTAELRHGYEHEYFRLEFTSRGHVVASGVIIDHSPLLCRLEFAFEADQTFCPEFLHELGRIVEQLHG